MTGLSVWCQSADQELMPPILNTLLTQITSSLLLSLRLLRGKSIFNTNHGRSEMLHVRSRLKKLLIFHDTMMLADTSVKTKGGNFGVITDKTLSFAEYFNEISKKACFAHFLFDGLKLLTNSLIFS